MKFQYPDFLWALFIVLVPVIIHLVNLRRHVTVYFSNVGFLKRVKKETLRKSKLKQLLILMSRIMMLAALVLAFSKPYIPSGIYDAETVNKVVCIYIDNSSSMSADGPEGLAIESAKQKARAIVSASMPDTKFALLTNDLRQKQYRYYSHQEVDELIGEVEVGHMVTPLSTILLRINSLLNNFLHKTGQSIYLISDFQKNSTDFLNLLPDTISSYNFVPIPVNDVPNLYLDSCWFESPAHHLGQVEELNVRVVNDSKNEYVRMPVQLFINDSLKALSSVDLGAGETKIVHLQYTNLDTGIQRGKLSVSDYPVIYDNQIFFTYQANAEIRVLLIHRGGENETRNFQALFGGDDLIRLERVRFDRLQISKLSAYPVIILSEIPTITSGLSDELAKYTLNGGTLVFIPTISADTGSYNGLYQKLGMPLISSFDTVTIPVGRILFDDLVYRDVFRDESGRFELPSIRSRYRYTSDGKVSGLSLLEFADRSAALNFLKCGNGKVYNFSFSLTENGNDFVNHILFVPTFYNIVLYSSPYQELFFILGRDRNMIVRNETNKSFQNPVIRNISTGDEFVPTAVRKEGSFIRMEIDPAFDAGFYEVYVSDEKVGEVALNYDLKESDMNYYKSSELITFSKQAGIRYVNLIEQKPENFQLAVHDLDFGKQLWKVFITFALFFLLFELLIIRFWDMLF